MYSSITKIRNFFKRIIRNIRTNNHRKQESIYSINEKYRVHLVNA